MHIIFLCAIATFQHLLPFDAIDEQNSLSPVYMIQPVVITFDNRFENRLYRVYSRLNEQSVRSTRLSNRLSNRFDNRLYRVNGVLDIRREKTRSVRPRFRDSHVTLCPVVLIRTYGTGNALSTRILRRRMRPGQWLRSESTSVL